MPRDEKAVKIRRSKEPSPPGIKEEIPIIFAMTKAEIITKIFNLTPRKNPIIEKNNAAADHSQIDIRETSEAYFFEMEKSPSFLIFESKNKTG